MKSQRVGKAIGYGKGYRNLNLLDVSVHSRSGRGIPTYSKYVRLPKRGVVYHSGLFQNRWKKGDDEPLTPTKAKQYAKSIDGIKEELFDLLFNVKEYDGEKATDPEILTITVLRDKAHHIDFLQVNTRWYALGNWKDELGQKYGKEKNFVFQVQFLDTKNEKIGKRVKYLLEELNKREIGEMLLYFDTRPVEESSLNLTKNRKLIMKG